MLIGELLRERGWVDPTGLDRAIAEQRHTGKRLCSLLVARGLIDPDVAARALGAQLNVAAALTRHLENRDRRVIRLVPAELARSVCALPIGRGRSGELIVVVRDPRPSVQTVLAQATGEPILVAITPAAVLEKLVDQTYGTADTDEFDVDLSTGPIDVLPEPGGMRASSLKLDLTPAPLKPPPPAGPMSLEAIDINSLSLASLDDDRVTKDHNQHSSQFALPRVITPAVTTPMPNAPPPAQTNPFAEGTSRPGPAIKIPSGAAPAAAPKVSLDDTMVKLERTSTRDAATDIAMAFVRGRWVGSLMVTIKEGTAFGHRGHGGHLTDDSAQAVTVPLATASIIRAAHDARALVTDPPPKGAIQDRVNRLLGTPARPAAVAVTVGQRVACVLVVGDPAPPATAADAADAALDLDDLAVALGNAYARIVRETKR